MKFQNEKKFYDLWLYYFDKKRWKQIYNLYKFLIECDIHLYSKFKIYVDTNPTTDRFGNILNHEYLLESVPIYLKEKLFQLFKEASDYFPKKMNHIISDIDDTILKSYYLPNHDYSMKIYKHSNNIYPYLYQYFIKSFENINSSKYVTFCSLRTTFLYNYTKNNIDQEFLGEIPSHLILSDNFIFFYYAFYNLFNYEIRPFTKEWIEKYFYGGIAKFNKISLFSYIYPEYDLYFFGDTGEGDLLTASLLLLNNRIKYAFLHDILEIENKSYIKENKLLRFFKMNIMFSFIKIKNFINVEIVKNNKVYYYRIYLFKNFDQNSIHNVMTELLYN
jgi:hypothetical protein